MIRTLTRALPVALAAVFGLAQAQYFEYDPKDPKQQAPIRPGEKANTAGAALPARITG